MNNADVLEFMQRRNMSVGDLAATIGVDVVRIAQFVVSEDDPELERLLLSVGVIPGTDDPPSVEVSTPRLLRPAVEEPTSPTVSPVLDSPVRRFTNSELQTFKRCRRKWWLAWHRGLVANVESPTGVMKVGTRIHLALEVMYAPGGPYPTILLPTLEKILAEEEERIQLHTLDEVTKKAFMDDANLSRIMLEGYLQWLEETGADSNLEIIGSEMPVGAPIHVPGHENTPIHLYGRLDVMARRKSDGVMKFIDHKTVGNLGQPMSMLPLNEQMRHYQLIQWLTALEVDRVSGAIFNMMRRVKRTAKATPPFYGREDVTYNRHVMENYYDRVIEEIKQILLVEWYLENDANPLAVVYPSPRNECTWDCPFFGQCSMFDDGSRAEDAIAAGFHVDDPYKYYDRPKEESAE